MLQSKGGRVPPKKLLKSAETALIMEFLSSDEIFLVVGGGSQKIAQNVLKNALVLDFWSSN